MRHTLCPLITLGLVVSWGVRQGETGWDTLYVLRALICRFAPSGYRRQAVRTAEFLSVASLLRERQQSLRAVASLLCTGNKLYVLQSSCLSLRSFEKGNNPLELSLRSFETGDALFPPNPLFPVPRKIQRNRGGNRQRERLEDEREYELGWMIIYQWQKIRLQGHHQKFWDINLCPVTCFAINSLIYKR